MVLQFTNKQFILGDCFKIRNHNLDSVSASSGSPPSHLLNGNSTNNGYHHPSVPMNQLREMLTTSDTEHSSDHHDHHDDHDDHDSRHDDHEDLHPHHDDDDVKDLSLRSSNIGHDLAQQAPVITSTAAAIHLVSDSASNHDFDSSASRSSSVHLHDHSSQSPPPRSSSDELRSVRMRKLSDTSTSCHHDIEHNTVNSYKFKNYIQQRFSQDTNHHEEVSSVVSHAIGHKSHISSSPINEALLGVPRKKPKLCLDEDFEHNSCDAENKPIVVGIAIGDCKPDVSSFPMFKTVAAAAASSVQSSTMLPSVTTAPLGSQSVPVFALHSQGRFYVPLSVDYEALVPYLGGIDLLESKSFIGSAGGGVASIPPLHSININVNFAPPASGGRLKGTSSSSGLVSNHHLLTTDGTTGVVGPVSSSQTRPTAIDVKMGNTNCW